MRELPSEDETQIEYHPKEYFGDEFQERIDQMLKDTLIECAYDNLTTARFNMKDFDVEVNGHKRQIFTGKGTALISIRLLRSHSVGTWRLTLNTIPDLW